MTFNDILSDKGRLNKLAYILYYIIYTVYTYLSNPRAQVRNYIINLFNRVIKI